MRDAVPQVTQLKDYTPPAFRISHVALDVDIEPGEVTIRATLQVTTQSLTGNMAGKGAARARRCEPRAHLGARSMGATLAASDYKVDRASHLTIRAVPDAFTLATVARFDPWKNTRLEGLYATASGLVTQCEAEGFRHITWFIDRPDVMATYAVTLCADKERFPRLLANGNLVASGEGRRRRDWFITPKLRPAGERHWAKWEDPFPKPSYLFAMVAANLELLEDRFTTRSGKDALLQVYVEPGKLDQAGFAMQALKKCMRWDEEVFGLELDLERFMIVAVSDFNAGAMENKGLNIFNTKFILARADTATDYDYYAVDRVVAHEYFHNWTGNRVTCRDWFQLSLKEGLTVYRDQEYGADEYSRPVVRIQEVRNLRSRQFPEDAGPMAHSVRPESYEEINNFYTSTVYDKGAEVVRMYAALFGKEGFRKGMDLYFQRHDGQAVTCDDFRAAMADANGVDLSQFALWYSQAGTPVLECRGEYDGNADTYTLHVKQSCPPTPGEPQKQPFVIPLAVGLVDLDGRDLPINTDSKSLFKAPRPADAGRTAVLALTEAEQTFEFRQVPENPVPSLLRGFSAPVRVRFDYTDTELTHLMAYDSDAFNRWEAGQALAIRILLAGVEISAPGAADRAGARRFRRGHGPHPHRRREGSRVRRGGPAASLGRLPRRMHGRGRPGRDPRRAHPRDPRDRQALPYALRGRLPPFHRGGPLFARRGRRGPARPAQRRSRVREHDRRCHLARARVPRASPRREHDRRHGRAPLPGQLRWGGARTGPRDVLRQVEG